MKAPCPALELEFEEPDDEPVATPALDTPDAELEWLESAGSDVRVFDTLGSGSEGMVTLGSRGGLGTDGTGSGTVTGGDGTVGTDTVGTPEA